MTKALLQVKLLTKSFTPKTSAVNEVSFAVAAGEIICLLGPSGCGKTTLLRMIAGLEQPDAGEVLFEGRNIVGVPPHRRDFGMMFQDFALFPHKNVFENVAFGLQMRRDSPEKVRTRVSDMLTLVDLQGFEERDINQLSGGEQQRVALARSLAPGPRLLMLDEPLGSLDRALRERLMLDLRTILKRVGVTAIYVTHDQAEAFAIADRVVVMNAGRVEQMDTPQQVFAYPATPFVARFLGFHNLIKGTVSGSGEVTTGLGCLKLAGPLPPTGAQVTVLIKPQAANVITKRRTPAAGKNCNQLEVMVTAISFRGKYYQIWVEASGQKLMFELRSGTDWPVGDQVRLALAPEEMVVLTNPPHFRRANSLV
jgi:ABC-type Fe3+/spermidine/putrescine transport system ATPase subunit